jgi:hypothetical protein
MNTPFLKFTAGLLSKKLSCRYDVDIYFAGASRQENFKVDPHGGIAYRTGFDSLSSRTAAPCRIFPFVASPESMFIVMMRGPTLSVWYESSPASSGQPVWLEVPFGSVTLPYASQEVLREVHTAQTAGVMYFVHRSAPPMRLVWQGGTSFSWETLPIKGNTIDEDDKSISLPFQTANNYPGCISVLSGRLVLAATINDPQKLWFSQPFDYGNFTYFETVSTTYTQLKDSSTWADPKIPETEDVTTTRNIVGDGDAIIMEINSDENETIVGLAAANNLLVSTDTGEWAVPSSITANTPAATFQSRNGGTRVQPFKAGPGVKMLTSEKMIKDYQFSTDYGSYQSTILSFQTDALESGAVEMDYAQHPYIVMYALLADGTLAACLNEGTLGVTAWYTYSIKGHTIKSVAIASGTNSADRIMLVVTDGITDTLLIESADYLDLALYTAAGSGSINISDKMAATGYTVKALAADGTHSIVTVAAGGTVSPGDYPSTTRFITGFPIAGVWQSMAIPAADQQQGTDASEKVVINGRLALAVLETQGIQIAANEAAPYPLFKTNPTQPFTGIVEATFPSNLTAQAKVMLIQNTPEPAMVLAIYSGVHK